MNSPRVTVAISALNEEANIVKILESLVRQKEEGFVLEKILVISDGSKDNTVARARGVPLPKIEVEDHAERKGKAYRMNQVYEHLTSDYLVQFDADVVLEHDYVIRDLIAPLMRDARVGMCGGNPLPLAPQTFTEKAIACSLESYLPLRSTLRGGNNVYSALGCMLAFRKEFVQNVRIPEQVVIDDLFLYFACLSQGHTYAYAPSAIVRYRLPQTLRDHIRQNTRFASGPLKMHNYFSRELIERELHIPLWLKVRYRAEQLVRHPILSVYIYSVNKYCHYKAERTWREANTTWDPVRSTKT